MTKYNINELLERKKELEAQILEKSKELNCEELKYRKEVTVDHTRDDKNISEYIPREKQTIDEYTKPIFDMIDELAKVKTAIQKYNASKVLGDLQKREATRIKHNYLSAVRQNLPKDKEHSRKVTRADKDGVALETTEVSAEPMFDRKEVETRMNQFAAQERKINTSIQKQNLNAKIEL